MSGFVSGCCEGERCYCGASAGHKVEETVFFDDPMPARHPLTAYVCPTHFAQIMGPAVHPEESAFTSMRSAILRLHNEAVLSEGQAAAILKVDRVELRALADAENSRRNLRKEPP